APDIPPAKVAELAAEPNVADANAHDLDHVLLANPDAEFTTQTRMPDGSYTFQTQKLADVVKDLDGWESAAKELESCLIGLEAAEGAFAIVSISCRRWARSRARSRKPLMLCGGDTRANSRSTCRQPKPTPRRRCRRRARWRHNRG